MGKLRLRNSVHPLWFPTAEQSEPSPNSNSAIKPDAKGLSALPTAIFHVEPTKDKAGVSPSNHCLPQTVGPEPVISRLYSGLQKSCTRPLSLGMA